MPIDTFFFFQAEDGIRDLYVTGVQTCALPIFGTQSGYVPVTGLFVLIVGGIDPWPYVFAYGGLTAVRSEERRVGKECRSRRSRDPENKSSDDRGCRTPQPRCSCAPSGACRSTHFFFFKQKTAYEIST